ncbi:predicted protein [Chaetoceros tenuissimus]|uniref:Uncharacterized protein n=1 Tax=Chaetoceros tenuissimus TaxID=426638 RepID=A0AAD3CK70_9STRA|nr:predicted protein [Chaetoceros tenuissimus]
MASLSEKLFHLSNLENSYIAILQAVGSDDPSVQVGYKDDYHHHLNHDLDNRCIYDDHYRTISFCLQQILLNLEDEDIENQHQKQELKLWIERYPLCLGILNWEDYDDNDEGHLASQRFPFLLCEIILKKKFRLLPFLIEAGTYYFVYGLRGGLLQKLSRFDDIYRGYHEDAHEVFPHDLVYPEMTVLDAITCFDYDDSIAIEVLSSLKDMGDLQRNDVQEENLLSKTFFFGGTGMQERFNFLVEMNPEALLKEVDEADKDAFDIVHAGDGKFYNMYNDWTPALIIMLAACEAINFGVVFRASLKVFPRELGLLFIQAKDNSSYPSWKGRAVLLSYVNEWVGIHDAWFFIEYTFVEMTNRHALFSLDHEKEIYPFMPIAESLGVCCNDGDIKLTLLYYLLREDLSWSDAL